MKKRIIIMAVAIVLILSGCKPIGMFLQSVFESQDGDLRILYGRNGADYIYDHNVHLSYARGRREDYVGLYLDGESGKEQRILEADFQIFKKQPLKMNGCLSFRTTCIMFWISAVMMFPNIRRFPIPTA